MQTLHQRLQPRFQQCQGPGYVLLLIISGEPEAHYYIHIGMVRVVNSVNSGGKLIDGIGTQTHLGAGGAGGVQAAITALAATGCEIAITELDIAGASPNDYETVAKACLNTPACVR